MTEREKPKKPSKDRDKNKDWEKDRRLRFNKTFDVLAALLPQYDPSKPFSKIEILQRSILLIEELQKEKKELLGGSNKEILKNQEELENTINMLRSRNEQLMEILRKAEIPIPEFNTKNTWIRNYKLDSKIEEKFIKIKENNLNEMNLKKQEDLENKVIEFEKPKKYSKKLSDSDQSKLTKKTDKKKMTKKTKKKVTIDPVTTVNVPAVSTTQPPLMCLQIISNSIMVSSSSSCSDVNNTTPVSTTIASSSSSTTFSTIANPIMATGIFVPVLKLEPVKTVKNKKIKPKPLEVPGKLPIPPLPKKLKLEMEKKKQAEVFADELPPTKKVKTNAEPLDKVITPEKCTTDKTDCSKELSITTGDLANDIFENLQVPASSQHPSHQSLSPTAAYLMNFPLVSTKATEDEGKPDQEIVNTSKKVEDKETDINSSNQNTEMLLDDNFPGLFSLNQQPVAELQQLNTNTGVEEKTSEPCKMEKNPESTNKIPMHQIPEKVVEPKYSASAFNFDFVSKTEPLKPTFTFSLTSSITTSSAVSTSLASSTLPLPSLTTPTFIPKSNFDFLTKSSYTTTTSASCLNETFPSCAGKSLGIVTTTSSTPSFSFSLTTLATTTTNPTVYSSTTTKSASNFPNFSFPPPSAPQPMAANANFNNNPFSIDQQITTSIGTNFTFSLTNSVPSNQQMKYTSCPNYNTFNPFSTNAIQEPNVNNFGNNTNYSSGCYDTSFNRVPAKKQPTPKSTPKYNHQPVNWMMTTSSVTAATPSQYKMQNTDYSTILPPPPPPPPPLDTYYPDLKRNSDIFFAHPPGDDNFPWSPNKMSNILDGTHYPNTSNSFMPSTLPNLHGDLALSTTSADQISNHNNVSGNQNKVQNNFFSVSQLVDNNHQSSNINNQSMKLSHKLLGNTHHKPNNTVGTIGADSSTGSLVKPAIKKHSHNNYNIKQTSWNYSTESMLYDNNNIMPPPGIPPPPLPLAPAVAASSSSVAISSQKQSSCNIYSAESLIASSTNHNHAGNQASQKKEINKYNRNFNDNYNPIIPPPTTDSYFSMDYLNSNVANNDLNNSTTNFNNFLYNNNNNNYSGSTDNNYYTNTIDNYNNVNVKSNVAVHTNNYTKQYPPIKPSVPRNLYHNNINQTNSKHINTNRNIANSCSLPNYDTLPNTSYFQPAMSINSPIVEDPSFHLYHPSTTSSSYHHHHHHQLPSANLNNNTSSNNNSNVNNSGSTSLANFNLSTICPEINDKVRWG